MGIQTSTIQIEATDGHGTFNAYVAMPDQGTGPAVVVVQEIFGVNANMRSVAQWFAQEGFVAVVPDLFWRLEPGVELGYTEPERAKAFDLMGRFDVDSGIADIQAALNCARALPAGNGKAGVVGYCLGGKMAYLSGCHTDAQAAVGYYGVGLDQLLDRADQIQHPVMLHIAEEDTLCPEPARQAILQGLSQHPQATCHVYPRVGHAFARIQGEHYDAPAAELANGRTLALLREALAG